MNKRKLEDILKESSLKFDLERVKQEFYGRRQNHRPFYGYDCPDLVAKATTLRKKLLPFHQRRTDKLFQEIINLMNLGIGCGKHWDKIKDEPFAWVKEDTKFSHIMKIAESDLDMGSKFEDYPVVDIHVDYAEPHAWPILQLNKLASVMTARMDVSFGKHARISLIGTYDKQFYHVHINLGNNRKAE